MSNYNCFAYRNGSQCLVLKEMVCKEKKKCPFFKTENQYRQGIQDSRERLIKIGRILPD